MNETNYIKLEFPSKSSNEAFARTTAAAFAAQLDPTLEELGDIKTAVSEAVTNAIVHGYPDTLGRIAMRLRIIKGSTLEISIRDQQQLRDVMNRLHQISGVLEVTRPAG